MNQYKFTGKFVDETAKLFEVNDFAVNKDKKTNNEVVKEESKKIKLTDFDAIFKEHNFKN